MEFIPMYVDEPQNKEPGDIIKNTDWNNLFNLLMTQGNYNTDALLEITQTYPTTVQMEAAIAEQIVEIGAGDMAKAVYDTDNDGIVDMAETVSDGGITTDKLLNSAVTYAKLASDAKQMIEYSFTRIDDKARVKFGRISDLTPSSTQQGATDTYTTTNVYKTYNIGFTPTYLIIFSIKTVRGSATSGREIAPSFSMYADDLKRYWGGIAYPNHTICNGFTDIDIDQAVSTQEIFRTVSNGFKTHEYYYHKNSVYNEINFDNSYYLAIG